MFTLFVDVRRRASTLAERTVRAYPVVVLTPFLDEHLSLAQGVEDFAEWEVKSNGTGR